ncbi:hypothetical protein [Solilutibacter pythonis]|nr:hypothetical protein [Lysobacter pythonis]
MKYEVKEQKFFINESPKDISEKMRPYYEWEKKKLRSQGVVVE